MSTSPGQVPAAGWYPDPTDLSSLRYWDGATWAPPALPPDTKKKRNGCLKAFLILLGVLVVGTFWLLLIVLASGDSTTSTNPIPTPQTFLPITQEAWVEIAKDPDAAKGRAIVVYAYITQFDANTGPSNFLANAGPTQPTSEFELATGAWFVGNKFALSGVKQGDILKIQAEVLGSYTYDLQVGNTNTVPRLSISSFEKVDLLEPNLGG